MTVPSSSFYTTNRHRPSAGIFLIIAAAPLIDDD